MNKNYNKKFLKFWDLVLFEEEQEQYLFVKYIFNKKLEIISSSLEIFSGFRDLSFSLFDFLNFSRNNDYLRYGFIVSLQLSEDFLSIEIGIGISSCFFNISFFFRQFIVSNYFLFLDVCYISFGFL